MLPGISSVWYDANGKPWRYLYIHILAQALIVLSPHLGGNKMFVILPTASRTCTSILYFDPKLIQTCFRKVQLAINQHWFRWLVVDNNPLFESVMAWCIYPDNKLHGANMGPTWGRQDPGGPHLGHMKIAIWVVVEWLDPDECMSFKSTAVFAVYTITAGFNISLASNTKRSDNLRSSVTGEKMVSSHWIK